MKNLTEKLTILIVDDTPANIQVLGNVLRSEGYRIAFASEAEHLEKTVTKLKPDLILLDIMMPGVDGYEACRRLKTHSGLQDIPIVFLTAKSESEALIKGFEAGGADYVTKPFVIEELLARIRTHLRIKSLIKELENKNKLLEKLVRIDSLTKLYNHEHIIKRLQEAIAEAQRYHQPLSILMADIDYFKRINDEFGHLVGDEVLKAIATILRDNCREADIVGRYGGEEFLFILPNTDLTGAGSAAEHLRKLIEMQRWPYENLSVTISFGVSERTNENVIELIRNADQQLYQAKQMGRNTTSIEPEQNPESLVGS